MLGLRSTESAITSDVRVVSGVSVSVGGVCVCVWCVSVFGCLWHVCECEWVLGVLVCARGM